MIKAFTNVRNKTLYSHASKVTLTLLYDTTAILHSKFKRFSNYYTNVFFFMYMRSLDLIHFPLHS